MTDRVRGLTVVLDADYRDDDVKQIVTAIKMIKGVLEVSEHVTDSKDYINRSTVSLELQDKLLKFISEELK